MTARLSTKQREILEYVCDCCDQGLLGYSLTIEDSWFFVYDREMDVFMQNLERRGFLNIEKGAFYRITDAGRAAVGRLIA